MAATLSAIQAEKALFGGPPEKLRWCRWLLSGPPVRPRCAYAIWEKQTVGLSNPQTLAAVTLISGGGIRALATPDAWKCLGRRRGAGYTV